MSDSLPELLHAARAWFDAASAAGWLDDAARAKLDAVEAACPGDLFAHGARPLVVAFFGGTGVGKSSLLNRLAGTRLARTGAERPTSRELTIYLHESVPLANLPESLPADKVQVQRHASAALREVVWIDTPDVDSTAAENRALALACLPHVDLVVYVVSPERYRDDVGWRVLRERGHRHGWMFAMNRWDEGDPRQRDDLGRMLREAGFENPLIFRTACPPRPPAFLVADEFEDLKAAIGELVSQHGVAELERLGHAARLAELRAAIEGAAAALGDDVTWAKLHANLDAHLQRARVALIEGRRGRLRRRRRISRAAMRRCCARWCGRRGMRCARTARACAACRAARRATPGAMRPKKRTRADCGFRCGMIGRRRAWPSASMRWRSTCGEHGLRLGRRAGGSKRH